MLTDMNKLLVLFSCLFATGTDAAKIFRFANYYGSHMVLQEAPKQAQVWGYASTVGDTVRILLNGQNVANATVKSNTEGNASGIWFTLLPAQKGGGPVKLEAVSRDGHVTLTDVMFGDVWICSGQSNMGFTMNGVYNSSYEVQHSTHFQNIRILKSALKVSNTTFSEPVIATNWQKPSNSSETKSFSAVCLLYAIQLSPHINRPIGLVETAWGGTPIEAWSSRDALAACHHVEKRAPSQGSVLWNAMVYPFLRMTIFGAIWYQGESNAAKANAYACQFPAMISDWRLKFNSASHGQTDELFPFGFVQLAPNGNTTSHSGFPDLRWAQTANFGYVPNTRLKKVFMAVTLDLPDFSAPTGSVHPRDKQDVAARLALAARAVAYNELNIHSVGPYPSKFTLSEHRLAIEFDSGNTVLDVRAKDGYEVCCGHTVSSTCQSERWTSAPIIQNNQTSITLDTSGCRGNTTVVTSVRYAWAVSPCSFKHCAVYGQDNDLPAPPFIRRAPFDQ